MKWTLEAIKEEASKFSTRGEFRKKSPSAYQAALRKGWLDLVFPMEFKRRKWTFEAIKEEASKFSTRGEFSKSSAYNAAWRKGWLDRVLPKG
jgi:hypothetical protein